MNHYQNEIKFENGFGLSIICKSGSYGHSENLFEVALLRHGDIVYNKDFPDVLGWQSFADVGQLIEKVEGYPAEMGFHSNLLSHN
jgi:hypothetical protein